MKRKLLFVSAMTLAILATSLLVAPALAQGLFDKECPRCHGTGKVSCANCDSTGIITCDNCDGSGTITTTVDCPTCYGAGEIQPSIVLKDMNGWGTLVGFDWVARVEGVFHNEEDQGTYGIATSEVNTVTETFHHSSPRTYFPPHEDVTITIDTPEITFGQDWTYSIYISSVDDITCPDCDGSGAKSVITTCPDCDGIGTVDCPNCDGAGTVTCPVCNGSGYVHDPTRLWIVSAFAIIVIAIVGVSAFVLVRRKKPMPEVKPETKTK